MKKYFYNSNDLCSLVYMKTGHVNQKMIFDQTCIHEKLLPMYAFVWSSSEQNSKTFHYYYYLV